MSGFPGQSGNQGYISLNSCDVQELTHWTMDYPFGVGTYNARSGAGWQKTVSGNKKISGTLTGKFTPGNDIRTNIDSTSILPLVLNLDASSYWSGNARISNIKMSSNIDTGEPQEWTADYESHGAWTKT